MITAHATAVLIHNASADPSSWNRVKEIFAAGLRRHDNRRCRAEGNVLIKNKIGWQINRNQILAGQKIRKAVAAFSIALRLISLLFRLETDRITAERVIVAGIRSPTPRLLSSRQHAEQGIRLLAVAHGPKFREQGIRSMKQTGF